MNLTGFICSLVAGLSTMIGCLFILTSKNKTLNFLICGMSFASSIMLFLSILDLLPYSISLFSFNYNFSLSLIITLLFFTLGITLSFCFNKIFPSDNNLNKIGLITMLCLGIHNIPEGIVTFITTSNDLNLGLSITFSIIMHNIPEGISVALPIYYSSKSKRKAILYTFICSIFEPLGAFFACLFFIPNHFTLGIMYSLLAGIMIYISLFILLPSINKYKRYRIIYSFYILGLVFILLNKILF